MEYYERLVFLAVGAGYVVEVVDRESLDGDTCALLLTHDAAAEFAAVETRIAAADAVRAHRAGKAASHA